MARWIDADALIEKINTAFWSEIGKVIDDLPSIDIVRCKDCKWYDLVWHECTGEVNSTDDEGGASYSLNFYDDDFCSYGERRE